jgi:hypothetical protein
MWTVEVAGTDNTSDTLYSMQGNAVPLHAMEALGGEEV